MLHIGIVASSAEGAALCYRTICVEGADLLGPYNHPEVSMHGHPFIQYKNCIDANDWAGVAELMLSSSEKLAKAGADFVEAGDPNASTMVYVDKDSGWLVVWATDVDAQTRG